MSLTIEATHSKILAKLSIVQKLTDGLHDIMNQYATYLAESVPPAKSKAGKHKKEISTNTQILHNLDDMIVRADQMHIGYNMRASTLLAKYYNVVDVDTRESESEFYGIIQSANMIGKMNIHVGVLEDIVDSHRKNKTFNQFLKSGETTAADTTESPSTSVMLAKIFAPKNDKHFSRECFYAKFMMMVQNYESYAISEKPRLSEQAPLSRCDAVIGEEKCTGRMTVHPVDSEMRCDVCGNTVTLEGTVFEDCQFYNQQGRSSRHKRYDFRKHGAKWLDQLQGNESKTFPEGDIALVNEYMRNQYSRGGVKRPMTDMTCAGMRECLKTLGLTKYNQHVPLLRKIITGLNGKAVSPEQLTSRESQLVMAMLTRAMELFEEIKEETLDHSTGSTEMSNRPYYPYMMFKIILIVIKGNRARINRILENIHLQSDSTLLKHDVIWKQICDRSRRGDRLVYKPTDKTSLIS